MENIWLRLNNLSFNNSILLHFLLYLTVNRIKVGFEEEVNMLVWPGVMESHFGLRLVASVEIFT